MNERDIFQAAVEIENPTERAGFLAEACENQPGVRHNVEALLKHYEDAGSFLERPPAELERTRLFDEQATDENSLASTCSPEGVMSDETLRSYLTPSEIPGVLGTLDQYEVLEKIGQGGMGIVLKAKDTKLHRIVAIKLLAPELASNPMARKRFLREARAAAAVTHDHVVRIYAVNDSPKIPMLVMECIDGQSLQQKLDKTGALEVKEILRIGLQAALGLSAAHKQGLVHRDIKPANILLENGIQRVKITDFGLARAVDDIGMTKTGQITGTPQYMSPEQAQGDTVDYRSDLFSLGSVLYAMCTGRAAFRADSTVAVLRRVCDDQARPISEINPDIPPVLADIVEQLMEKNPEHRFQSAQEVADVLAELLAQIQQLGNSLSTMSVRSFKFKSEKSPRTEPAPRVAWGKTLLCIALLALGLLGVSEATGVTRFASTIIRVVSGDGTLIIETDDPSIEVTVDGQGSRQEVRVTGMGVNLTLKPGQYQVTASKDGKPVQQELVTITRNGKNVVRITMEGHLQEASKGLSEKLQQELSLAIGLGQGEMSGDAFRSMTESKHSLLELNKLPIGEKVLDLLADLPLESRKQLIEEGYLKWPHAGLSEHYRDSFTEVVELFLKEAKEMGFGGGKNMSDVVMPQILNRGWVGFAAIDFPNSQKAITFYVLWPHSPVPLGMPIVPENPKDWESLELGLEQFDQLKKLAQKPNSFYPPVVSESLLKLPSRVSLAKSSRQVVKDGFRPVWTPDGKQILYSKPGVSPMQIHDLATGESKPFLSQSDLEPDPQEPKSLLDAALSPDGKTVALVLRPTQNGNQVYFQEEVWVVPFSGGPGRKLAQGGYPTFGNDSQLFYFQDRKRNVLCSIRLDEPEAKPLDVLPCPAWYPAVSPDGKFVAYSERENLHVVSLEDQMELGSWTYPNPASGMLLAWSPDSKMLGLCPYEGQTRLGFWRFDLKANEAAKISDDPIGEVAWSPDAKQLAYTRHQGQPAIYVMDIEQLPNHPKAEKNLGAVEAASPDQLTEIRQFQGHRGPVKQVAFSPDGKLAVSGSGWPNGDRSVRIWDVETGKQLRTSGTLPQVVMTVAFSPDGKLVAGGGFDGQIHIREASTGKFRHSLPGNTEVIEDVIFSPDGKTVLSIGHKRAYVSDNITIPDHGKAVLWELESQKLLWQFDRPGWLKTGGFSPDGKRVYVSGSKTGAIIHALDAKTGAESQQYQTSDIPTRGVEELAVSPDGQFLATASGSGAVHVWNIDEPTKPRERQLDPSRLLTVAYTSDGSHLVTGGHAGLIHVLNAKTLESVSVQQHPSGSVWHLAVSPDSFQILSAGGSTAEGETIKNSGDYATRLWQLPASFYRTSPAANSD